eukprot:1412656-Amphidinium_carterae.1
MRQNRVSKKVSLVLLGLEKKPCAGKSGRDRELPATEIAKLANATPASKPEISPTALRWSHFDP